MFDFSLENILHSNLINFIIVFFAILFIVHKLNLKDKLKNGAKSVGEDIKKSKEKLEDSFSNLNLAENKLKKSDEVCSNIIQEANSSSVNYLESAKEEAQKVILEYQKNSKTNIQKKILKIKNDISDELIENAIGQSVENIQKTLDKKTQETIIENSIKQLDGIEF